MRPVFIASVGNPGSTYAHTLHSAGHTLLAALASYANFPSLTISKQLTGTKGRFSHSDASGVAFWESPNYMNDSGPDLATAWRKWSSGRRAAVTDAGDMLEPRLIILHDELELPCGKISIKTSSGGSARGHNGLKSFLGMPNMKQLEFTRVGVGIGPRPLSREPDQVAKYVLKKMTGEQRAKIEGLAGEVWAAVERIRIGEEAGGGKAKAPKVKKERKERERGASQQPRERVVEGLEHVRSHSV